jgi:hypothetical protein
MNHRIREVHLVPPEGEPFAICSSARLHEQNDRNAEVWRCCCEDSLFLLDNQHPLGGSFPSLVKVFHASGGTLGDVFAIHRELEHALETFEVPVHRSSLDRAFRPTLGRLAAAVVAVFFDHPLPDICQSAVSEKRL